MSETLKRINALQRKIIIASIAYYEFDERIMSDCDYDNMSQELKELMIVNDCPEKENSKYWYAFKDWTGATRCFLRSRLNDADRTRLEEAAQIACEEARDYREQFLYWR